MHPPRGGIIVVSISQPVILRLLGPNSCYRSTMPMGLQETPRPFPSNNKIVCPGCANKPTHPQTVSVVVVYKVTATTLSSLYPKCGGIQSLLPIPIETPLCLRNIRFQRKTKLFLSCCAPV